MDEREARNLVLAERDRIEALVREEESVGTAGEAENEQFRKLAGQDQHPADFGTEVFEREKERSILERLQSEFRDLDRAVQKLDEGTYGWCEACGREISPDRLEARPGARFCIDDERRQ